MSERGVVEGIIWGSTKRRKPMSEVSECCGVEILNKFHALAFKMARQRLKRIPWGNELKPICSKCNAPLEEKANE